MHASATQRLLRTDRHCQSERIRLCYLVTNSKTSRLLHGQLRYMRDNGYEVTLITSPGKESDHVRETEGVDVRCVPMEREIHPLRDLRALVQLYRVFRSIRPHIVNAGTPKAGLLGMLAAALARVPIRVYTLRGLRLETTRGLKRRVLAFTERVASACAHRIICISTSLAEQYVRLGFANPAKAVVLGSGSSNGINVDRFECTPHLMAQAQRIRGTFGILPSEPVVGYVGRLTQDKGISDIVRAFEQISHRIPNVWLLLVGELEAADAPDDDTVRTIRRHPRIYSTGFVDDVAPYYHAMSVLAFPSYREGFGNAIIEAQAAGLPVVGYRATGVVDAVLDGVTGRLVPTGAVDELATALLEYIHDPKLAAAHGERGRHRARSEFSNERIWNALVEECATLLHAAGLASLIEVVPQRSEARAA